MQVAEIAFYVVIATVMVVTMCWLIVRLLHVPDDSDNFDVEIQKISPWSIYAISLAVVAALFAAYYFLL